MINLFRKIRQKHLAEYRSDMQEGSLRKYMMYAVGEIVLIVFGILIALQIDNWNTSRQKKQDEKKYIRI